MSRFKAIVLIIGGLVIWVLGFGMWRDPQIDWQGFLNAWYMLGEEFVRLKDDPFAILGILILVVGTFIIYQGIKRLVSRS